MPKFLTETEIITIPQKKISINFDKNIKTKITEKIVEKNFFEFLQQCNVCKTKKAHKLLKKAYFIAKEFHKDEKRYSGDVFINHPVEVAKIVANQIGLSLSSIIAALLHDVVSNTDFTIEDVEISFNKEIAKLVSDLTKIKGTSNYFDTNELDVYKRILASISQDIRIIYIKIADRLHNMRTIKSLTISKQQKVANETLYVYAPLADRLGLFLIKSELEDLAFNCINPKEYSNIANRIKYSRRKNIIYLNKFSLPIISKLIKNNYKFDIKSRQKSVYSIWKKIHKKNLALEDIYDIFAIRIIIEPKSKDTEIAECKEIFNFFMDNYDLMPNRIRNWIDKPKDNGYQAIHVTVKAPNDRWVEIQIRSKKMNEIAEKGLAAHWKYKKLKTHKINFDNSILDLKNKLESVNNKNFDYLSNKNLIFTNEIFVYTPNEKLFLFKTGATVLDFAFAIHSKLGEQCIGAKINYKFVVPIDYKLKTGDVVEVLTSKKQIPKTSWLKIVKTKHAKRKIIKICKIKHINEIEKGQQILEALCKKNEYVPNHELFRSLISLFRTKNKKGLYYKIGDNQITEKDIDDVFKRKSRWKIRKFIKPQFTKIFANKTKAVTIEDDNYIVPKCCNPLPGDKVIGFKNKNNIYVIHKEDCSTSKKLIKKKNYILFPISWKVYKAKSFLARISIEAYNQIGLLHKITSITANNFDINIKSIHFESTNNEFNFSGWLEIYVLNKEHLDLFIKNLLEFDGIIKVERMTDKISNY